MPGTENEDDKSQKPASDQNKPITQADVDAAVKAATKKATADAASVFATQFKEATGADSLEAFKAQQTAAADAKAKADGDFEKLADQKTAENAELQSQLNKQTTRSAILAAGVDSVDPETIHSLLSGKATVADDGTVTVDGKTPADAVAALLKDKPYLAKASDKQGGGSPAGGTGGDGKAPERKDFKSDIDYHKAAAKFASQKEG